MFSDPNLAKMSWHRISTCFSDFKRTDANEILILLLVRHNFFRPIPFSLARRMCFVSIVLKITRRRLLAHLRAIGYINFHQEWKKCETNVGQVLTKTCAPSIIWNLRASNFP